MFCETGTNTLKKWLCSSGARREGGEKKRYCSPVEINQEEYLVASKSYTLGSYSTTYTIAAVVSCWRSMGDDDDDQASIL